MASSNRIKVALAGAPNSGKTSVFNQLTGLNQQVGNYPGVTVDKKAGSFISGDIKIELLDLPGTHSLYPISDDERVVLDVLINPDSKIHPDYVLFVANASNLQRSLLLLSQISDLGIPVVCCLNMMDIASEEGLTIDIEKLRNELDVPVIEINGRTGKGLDELKQFAARIPKERNKAFSTHNNIPVTITKSITEISKCQTNYATQLLAAVYNTVNFLSDKQKAAIDNIEGIKDYPAIKIEVEDKSHRIELLKQITAKAIHTQSAIPTSFSQTADKILTHRVWGTLILLAILFTLFQAIFTLAEPPMNWIDSGFAALNSWLKSALPAGWLTNLLTDGIVTGIGGIVIFVPQIAILFGLVAVLEESGYMTRAVYLSDNLMRNVGLNGRSLVALISGVACAVPAIMSTRTIGNGKERLITIFVTPFISCSARIPVFIVLVAFVIPEHYYLGFINSQGLVMMGLYLLGVLAAIGSAWILSKIIKSKDHSMLMLEMPKYQWPLWKNVGITMFEKSKVFIIEAGRVIMVVSVILWALASFGPGDAMQHAEDAVIAEMTGTTATQEEIDNEIAARQLEASYAGQIGKFIEPAIRPLGFDWKMGIALVTSFAAREVFISTMATLYSSGSAEDDQTIIERLRSQRTETGEMVYNPARSFSLLLFYVFAMQCMSTLAIAKRETKSWKIPILQFVYMTGLAYIASLIAYNIMA